MMSRNERRRKPQRSKTTKCKECFTNLKTSFRDLELCIHLSEKSVICYTILEHGTRTLDIAQRACRRAAGAEAPQPAQRPLHQASFALNLPSLSVRTTSAASPGL